ncbi:MAG: hypothetical protein NXI07_11880 [bacterium]|nr:hypothetical protein [bacterium]
MSEPHSQSRTIYTLLVLTVLAFSWLYMQWTHELGHILAGLASGATIDRVILDPRTFSMTQFHSTPHPLIAAWGGPILGVVIGAGIPLLLTRVLPGFRFSLRIVASFVLLANGLYIGLGAVYPVGDAHSLIMFGSPRWLLAIFGIACIVPVRLILTPVLSKQIQLSSNAEPVPYVIMAITLATIGLIMFR